MADQVEAARWYDEAFNAQDADARVANLTPDTQVTLPAAPRSAVRNRWSRSRGASGRRCRTGGSAPSMTLLRAIRS
jgi:hypothetical protein